MMKHIQPRVRRTSVMKPAIADMLMAGSACAGKIAMQPATVDGVTVGEGKPIDLVFNVTDEGSTTPRPHQVFSKINNYTDKCLGGHKIVVGRGTGAVGCRVALVFL